MGRDAVDMFLQNCGVGPLDVTLFRGPGAEGEPRVFDQPFVLCGRAPGNDLCLDDGQVSRRHVYLQAINGRMFGLDLNSRTGVHWPSGPQAAGWLEWDRPIRIGRAVLKMRSPESSSPALPPPADPLSSGGAGPLLLPGAVFELSAGTERLGDWRVNRALTLVGSSDGCKLRLRDGRVSRTHCALTAGPLGVWVVDLVSREGTSVNGERVRWSYLENEDVLEVGPFRLRLHYDAAPGGGDATAGGQAHSDSRRPPAPAPLMLTAPPRPALLEPADPGRLAAEKSLLLPVIDQFSQMQQQMFEQFHHSMMMMAEMFSTLHREQMALVREELGHMRRITEELQALQAELARNARDGAAEGRAVQVYRQGRKTDVVVEEAPAPEGGKGASEKAVVAEDVQAPGGEKGAAEEAAKPRKAVPEDGSAPAPPPAPEVHDWLSKRIAALQEERQGRWQKIVKFVLGK